MTELLKILDEIRQQTGDRATGKMIEDFLQKTRSLGLPTYSACKILESHLSSGFISNTVTGTEGWISEGDEARETNGSENPNSNSHTEPDHEPVTKIITEDLQESDQIKKSIISGDRKNYRLLRYLAFLSFSLAVLIFVLTKDPVRNFVIHSFPTIGRYIYSEHPPGTPRLVNPPNGAKGLPTLIKLSWDCSDPDKDHLKYDIYFGLSGSVLKLETKNWASKSFIKDGLKYDTVYSWQVVAKDINGLKTAGTVWNFRTKAELSGYEVARLAKGNKELIIKNNQRETVYFMVDDPGEDMDDSLLNIRKGPGTDYPVTDKLVAGEVVELLQDGLGEKGIWCKIYCLSKRTSGYVTKRYLRKI